jgi:DNA polymerase-3 subunit gamma/tau
MPLHTTYRPKTLKEFFGNDAIVKSLKSVLDRKKDKPHSFLFTGPSGCGKTTLARILKHELKCDDMDFYSYNAANTRGIDTIREINEKKSFRPMSGKIKIYMLEECHQITGAGIEAMLDMIEEPPSHVFFILCTTEPEKLKVTLKRRCHHYEVQPLFRNEMNQLIDRILDIEKAKIEKLVKDKIVSLANGSAGMALKMLDSVIDMDDEEQAIDALESTTVSEAEVIELCRELVKGRSWKKIKEILKGIKGEPESIRYAVLGYMNSVMLNNGGGDVAEVQSCFMDSYIYCGKAGLVQSCYLACRHISVPSWV